ncbi:Uma2 family endonuclease [Archangium lipolyticum]|uniref:Uma2 family endonuclease n=1 Tax=Archangium lipolyticum TaxID=2970465 RepID=UPI002149C589|nr:Uma2 family endonuclease [Archangium lipolyticum]
MSYGAQPLHRPATMADLEALPETVRAEIIEGTLYVHPLLSPWHSHVAGGLFYALFEAFERGSHGRAEWWLLRAPGVQAGGSPEFVPDLAGWRRERFPKLPSERFTEAPDWICEVLSQGTRSYDQCIKRPFYARIGVRHLWFVDPDARMLTVSELIGGRWVELGAYREDDVVRAAPFEVIELRLGDICRFDAWTP